MPINTGNTTAKYGIKITTVDPTNNRIEGVLKTGGAARPIVVNAPIAFRWPVVGESWMVRQENGAWVLDGPFVDSNYFALTPGDAAINTPTGVIRVVGSSTDFALDVTNALGVGALKFSTVAAAPTGWLHCNGAAISRTVYANLFAAVGTTFGVGDGSTTFNVPTIATPFGASTYAFIKAS